MARLIVLIILLIPAVTCMGVIVGAHTTASQSGLDPDVAENIEVGLNYILVASCSILTALIARMINQVKLSRQIFLSFFLYSWRNSIYSRTHQIFPVYIRTTSYR